MSCQLSVNYICIARRDAEAQRTATALLLSFSASLRESVVLKTEK